NGPRDGLAPARTGPEATPQAVPEGREDDRPVIAPAPGAAGIDGAGVTVVAAPRGAAPTDARDAGVARGARVTVVTGSSVGTAPAVARRGGARRRLLDRGAPDDELVRDTPADVFQVG